MYSLYLQRQFWQWRTLEVNRECSVSPGFLPLLPSCTRVGSWSFRKRTVTSARMTAAFQWPSCYSSQKAWEEGMSTSWDCLLLRQVYTILVYSLINCMLLAKTKKQQQRWPHRMCKSSWDWKISEGSCFFFSSFLEHHWYVERNIVFFLLGLTKSCLVTHPALFSFQSAVLSFARDHVKHSNLLKLSDARVFLMQFYTVNGTF